MEMKGKKWEIMWNMMWKKYEKELKEAEKSHITVNDAYRESTAVFDAIGTQIDRNINTHRVIYLNQKENGKIAPKELSGRLAGADHIRFTGDLKTADGNPGIAEGFAESNRCRYDIVFSDLQIYSTPSEKMFETGGIANCDVLIKEDTVLKENLLCTGKLSVEKDACLSVTEGKTLVLSDSHIKGTLKGCLTGNLFVENGTVNGNLYAGKITVRSSGTLIGMFYGEQLKAEENTVLRMKEFGSLTTSMDLARGVTLEFEDAEPLVMQVDLNQWAINHGHTGGDAGFVGTNTTGNSWYLSNRITPKDMLGRTWSPELSGEGVLMPSMKGIGYVKNEKDLQLRVINNTEHNYALLMLNKYPFENIHGSIHIHSVQGVSCPSADEQAVSVSEVKGDGVNEPYYVNYSKKDENYQFMSSEEIAVQAATKKAVMARFSEIEQFSWQYAPDAQTKLYTWYGYEKGVEQEHWDGPTGQEKYIITIKKI